MNTTNNEKSTVWRGLATNEKSTVWRRIAIVTLLLLVLVGPNFGPLPHLLRQSLSLEGSITGVLIWFCVAFTIILAVIFRMIKSTSIGEFLKSHGLGAPSGIGANIAGLILGIVWALLFLSSILQFDPEANITQINGFRILTALLAAVGALLEDLITRSFIMNQLHKIGSSKWVQVIVPALIFALYHTVWGFNPFSFVLASIPLHHVYPPRWVLKSNRQNCQSLYTMIWDTRLKVYLTKINILK